MTALRVNEDNALPDSHGNTVALVRLLAEIGPDIAEISRRLGQYKESVRYRYKEKIVNNGFAIKATPNYGALGLKRVVMRVRVADTYREISQQIFAAMSDFSYVVAFAGTVPDNSHLLHAALPFQFDREFREMMSILKDKGIFDSVELFDCDRFRVAPMRAECFDFEHGVWDFDWSKPLSLDGEAARTGIWNESEFDKTDLLIVKELSKDGRQSIKEIQESIRRINGVDINYKTLVWHFKNHVSRRQLINGYAIGWHGVKYDFDADKKNLRPHGYLPIALIVKGISDQERMTLMGTLNRVPFLWSEASGRDYYAQFAFPVENTNEALEYLGRVVRPFGSRAACHVLNQKDMLSFTIGHNLWDSVNSRWTFEPQGIVDRFDALLVKLREMGSSRSD